jgi:nicotinamidase-related amidase
MMKKAQLVIDAQNGMFQEGDVVHNSKNRESNLVDN